MPFKVALTFKCVEETLVCDNSNESDGTLEWCCLFLGSVKSEIWETFFSFELSKGSWTTTTPLLAVRDKRPVKAVYFDKKNPLSIIKKVDYMQQMGHNDVCKGKPLRLSLIIYKQLMYMCLQVKNHPPWKSNMFILDATYIQNRHLIHVLIGFFSKPTTKPCYHIFFKIVTSSLRFPGKHRRWTDIFKFATDDLMTDWFNFGL